MPRRWVRATRDRKCGYCVPPRWVLRGEPMLEIALVQVKRTLVRCPHCVGEPVPELPPLPEPTAPRDVAEIATMAREWLPYRDED